MKKVTFNLFVGIGLVLGTAALFGQKSFNTITPLKSTEKNRMPVSKVLGNSIKQMEKL